MDLNKSLLILVAGPYRSGTNENLGYRSAAGIKVPGN